MAVGSENCFWGIPDLILGGSLDDLIQFLRFLGFQENTRIVSPLGHDPFFSSSFAIQKSPCHSTLWGRYPKCLDKFQEGFSKQKTRERVHINTCPQISILQVTALTFVRPQSFRFLFVSTLKAPSVFWSN